MKQNRYSPRLTLAVLAVTGFGLAPLASAESIFIDFGASTTQMTSPTGSTYWNNVTNLDASSGGGASTGFTLGLVTESNAASGITLTITQLFANENHTGASSPTTSVSEFNYSNLGIDSLYISGASASAGFTLTGLDPTKQYQFTIYAARNGVGDIRTADYTFTGAAADTVTLDASNNTSNVVTTALITPDGSDTITFSMVQSAGNTGNFAYLGGLEISVIPEPATTAGLAGVAILTVALVRRRRARR